MKRQLLMSLSLSLLASTAFALPASEQATPQVKDSHSVYSQTVAEGGRERLEQKGLAADGSDHTPQGQTLAADGSDRTKLGESLAEGGRDKLEEKGLVEGGYEHTPQGQLLAADGGDRVIERRDQVS